MFKFVKVFVFVLILSSFIYVSNAKAATINAASCSQSDVQAAINEAKNGDTVKVPSGSKTWSSKISVNKEIAIIGSGIGNTKITGHGFDITDGTDNWRITGFEFTNSGLDNSAAPIELSQDGSSNGCRNFRIDSCKFTNYDRPLFIYGHSTGVIDHCEFIGSTSYDRSDGIRVWGDNSAAWQRNSNIGTSDFVFIEDCTFNTNGIDAGHCVTAGHGGRCVLRYNKIIESGGAEIDSVFDSHGYCHGTNVRGARAFEVYGNTMTRCTGAGWARIFNIRGGTGVIYDNTSNEAADRYDTDIELQEYRVWKSSAISSSCSGDCSRSRWCPEADGGEGYPCCDQVGVGANKINDPLYIWNNKDHTNTAWVITVQSACTSYIKAGRDYYLSEKPGYAPYTYPHPLVEGLTPGSGSSEISPPEDLHVIE